jgi:hypothetical protein
MLLTVLLVAVVLLAPGQPRQAIGIEIAAISEILAFQAILIARPAYEHMRDRLSWVLWAMLLLLLPALALMIGGISFAIEAGGGLYWVFWRGSRAVRRTRGLFCCSSKFSGDGRKESAATSQNPRIRSITIRTGTGYASLKPCGLPLTRIIDSRYFAR